MSDAMVATTLGELRIPPRPANGLVNRDGKTRCVECDAKYTKEKSS